MSTPHTVRTLKEKVENVRRDRHAARKEAERMFRRYEGMKSERDKWRSEALEARALCAQSLTKIKQLFETIEKLKESKAP